ncbi:MAG: hypothetical protein KAY50_00550 [Chitinophagaceae bacterium]|nr:hypothetical protein [Chitinophagaceae bacterium]
MSLLNFGLYQGLSAKIPYDNMMDRETKLAEVRRQTRIDAENKAKLLGDDMKFATMTSDFQREKLNGYYSEHLKKIGDFVIKNPDLQMNPAKMMQFNQMKHQMLDNPIVAADMRFKTESDALTKFISENPDTWKDDPEVKGLIEKRDLYNKYGTTTPGKGDSEFIFINPDSKVNLTEEMRKHFSAIDYDGFEETFGNQKNGYKKWVSDDAMYRGAQSFIESNPKFKRMAQNMFKNLSPEDQKRYVTGSGQPDIALWIKEQGRLFKKSDDVASPVDFKPGSDGSSSGAGAGVKGTLDHFKKLTEEASANPGTWRTGNVNGLRKALMSDGKANLSAGELLTINGERYTPSDSDNIPAMDDDAKLSLLATGYGTPTGQVKIDPNDGLSKARWLMEVPIEEFEKSFPQYGELIDYGGVFGGSDSGNTMRAKDGSKFFDGNYSTVFKAITKKDKDGKDQNFVQFNLQAPLVDNKTNQDYTMNNAYNAGVDGLTGYAGVDTTPSEGAVVHRSDGSYRVVRGEDGKLYGEKIE